LPDGSRARLVEDGGNLTVLLPRGEIEPPRPALLAGTTRWYVPYTAVHPRTVESAPRDAVWVDVSNSPNAYYAMLLDVWARGESFALLEHDVECRPDVIEAFETCPEPWCLYAYADICHRECREGWRNQLGCTRFRAEAMQLMPDALSSIPREGWDWHNLCDRIGERLRAAGLQHHWHEPAVGHHRETHRIS
jgi:hypothetical protein